MQKKRSTLHLSFMFQWGGVGGWGGVGWDDNVHVPMHTQAQQPHQLSCCWAETGTALLWSVTGGVGWVNKVHVPMHTDAQQPHHLSCCRALTRTALSGLYIVLNPDDPGRWSGDPGCWSGVHMKETYSPIIKMLIFCIYGNNINLKLRNNIFKTFLIYGC